MNPTINPEVCASSRNHLPSRRHNPQRCFFGVVALVCSGIRFPTSEGPFVARTVCAYCLCYAPSILGVEVFEDLRAGGWYLQRVMD